MVSIVDYETTSKYVTDDGAALPSSGELASAYRLLGTEDHFVPDSVLIASYGALKSERPDQTVALTRALTTIAIARKSQSLLALAGPGQMHSSSPVPIQLVSSLARVLSRLEVVC